MGGKNAMKQKYRRPMMVFFLLLSVFIARTQIAFATTPSDNIDEFNSAIMQWYYLLLQSVVFPLEILSFATSGLSLLFSPLMSSPQAMDKIKTKIFMSVSALIVMVMLPTIIGWGTDFFQSTGWQPPRATPDA